MVNMFLFEASELGADGRVSFKGDHAKHMKRVLRVKVGDELRMGCVDVSGGKGTVVELHDDHVVCQYVADPLMQPKCSEVILVVATPRPSMVQRILATMSTMFAHSIYLMISKRTERSYLTSKKLSDEALRKALVKGAEQGVTWRIPRVHKSTENVEEWLSGTWPAQRALWASEGRTVMPVIGEPGSADDVVGALQRAHWGAGGAKQGLGEASPVVAIGPEGGWIGPEVAQWVGAGFVPFHMGPSILRSETAVTAVLAQLQLVSSCASRMLPYEPQGDELDDDRDMKKCKTTNQ